MASRIGSLLRSDEPLPWGLASPPSEAVAPSRPPPARPVEPPARPAAPRGATRSTGRARQPLRLLGSLLLGVAAALLVPLVVKVGLAAAVGGGPRPALAAAVTTAAIHRALAAPAPRALAAPAPAASGKTETAAAAAPGTHLDKAKRAHAAWRPRGVAGRAREAVAAPAVPARGGAVPRATDTGLGRHVASVPDAPNDVHLR